MWVVLVHNSFHWKFENARENYDANHPLLCAPNQIITSLTRFAIALAKLLVKIRVSMESNFFNVFDLAEKQLFLDETSSSSASFLQEFFAGKLLFSIFFAIILLEFLLESCFYDAFLLKIFNILKQNYPLKYDILKFLFRICSISIIFCYIEIVFWSYQNLT